MIYTTTMSSASSVEKSGSIGHGSLLRMLAGQRQQCQKITHVLTPCYQSQHRDVVHDRMYSSQALQFSKADVSKNLRFVLYAAITCIPRFQALEPFHGYIYEIEGIDAKKRTQRK